MKNKLFKFMDKNKFLVKFRSQNSIYKKEKTKRDGYVEKHEIANYGIHQPTLALNKPD